MYRLKLVHFLLFVQILQDYTAFVSSKNQCYLCGSTKSSIDCLTLDSNSVLSTCNSTLDKCYTIIVNDTVHRGCVGDDRFPDLHSIKKCSDPKQCEICNSPFCNGRSISDVCIKCNSMETSFGCKEDPFIGFTVACSLAQIDGCYLKVTDNSYERGCIRDLNSNEQRHCQQQSKHCQTCSFPNCNQKANFMTKCYECHSPTCVNKAEHSRLQIDCEGLSESCATGISADGFLHRGCFSYHGIESIFPLGFEFCADNLCNNEIFPINRLKCYHCEGNETCENVSDLRPEGCSNLSDRCFSYLDKDGTFYRGCMKDESKGTDLCEQNAARCEVCDTSACNSERAADMNSGINLRANIIYGLISLTFSYLLFTMNPIIFLH